jgi:hypothetical protein
MHVVEHDGHRSCRTEPREEPGDRVEETESSHLRIGRHRRRQIGQLLLDLGKYLRDFPCAQAQQAAQFVRFNVADQRSQGLEPRPIRRGPAGLPTPAPRHDSAFVLSDMRDLSGEPRLPDARFPREENEPRVR